MDPVTGMAIGSASMRSPASSDRTAPPMRSRTRPSGRPTRRGATCSRSCCSRNLRAASAIRRSGHGGPVRLQHAGIPVAQQRAQCPDAARREGGREGAEARPVGRGSGGHGHARLAQCQIAQAADQGGPECGRHPAIAGVGQTAATPTQATQPTQQSLLERITQMPGYQFGMQEGTKSLEQSAANRAACSRGMRARICSSGGATTRPRASVRTGTGLHNWRATARAERPGVQCAQPRANALSASQQQVGMRGPRRARRDEHHRQCRQQRHEQLPAVADDESAAAVVPRVAARPVARRLCFWGEVTPCP